MAEIDQTCYAVSRVRHAARHDRVEVRQIRLDVDGDAVERHPAPQPHADGGDLVFKAWSLVAPIYPDADAILAPFALHVESRQRPNNPFLKASHISPHVGPPPPQVEHYVGHPLAGAVIGELPTAPGGKHRKAGIEQVSEFAAGSGSV